ncbi:c-type cytochrome [Acidicapsa dinghuensis]|uniref:C-type cytochrome n=1 Tax=Acidicapsa dinghuensis TaxID=2218256 RepID=A0ABW1EKN2_9BACT|nr:c-type cytochrome [Acidicapsa dinghuensis]
MKLRFQRLWSASACVLLAIGVAGCRQDMHNQPKMIPQRHSAFFDDGRSVRQQVPGTVDRGQVIEASYLTTGLVNGAEGDTMPFPVTMTVLARGQERFNIYCSPCHSRVGNGKGAIVGRGYYTAGNFQSARLRQAPIGHFFWVMTHGYGAMPNYSVEIEPADRWAIAAYIRALQLSQNAARTDLPAGAHVDHMRDLLVRASLPINYLNAWDVDLDDDAPVPGAAAAPIVANPNPATSPTSESGKAASPGAAKTVATPSASGKSAVPAGGEAPVTQEPAKPAATGDPDHGKVLYMNNCSVCHQPTRAGLPPVFPSLIGIVDKDGEAKVRRVAKEGIPDAKPPMPPHPDLTDKDIDDLIAFLKTR